MHRQDRIGKEKTKKEMDLENEAKIGNNGNNGNHGNSF